MDLLPKTLQSEVFSQQFLTNENINKMNKFELQEKLSETQEKLEEIAKELNAISKHKNFTDPNYFISADQILFVYNQNSAGTKYAPTFKYQPDPIIPKPPNYAAAKLNLNSLEKQVSAVNQQRILLKRNLEEASKRYERKSKTESKKRNVN